MQIFIAVVLVVAAYALGTFPSAAIIAGKKNLDITKVGSGNPGASNVIRNLGWKTGLAVFLLDMGLSSGRNLKALWGAGWQPFALALLLPLVNGTLMALLSSVTGAPAEARFMLSVLAASASYIAVPAAMRIALPEANPGIYLPMALALTFPVNMTLGIPWYYWLVS